jgi:hypothetical protein
VEFKNKFRFQTSDKSIQIQLLTEIQVSDPLLLGTYFSLQLGEKGKPLTKFHQIPSSQKFPFFFSLISTRRNFSEFSFKIHFESEEVSIRKVVPYFEYSPTIFYFKFLEHGAHRRLETLTSRRFSSPLDIDPPSR